MKYTIVLVILSCGLLSIISSCKKENKTTPVPIVVDSVKSGLIAYYPFNNNGADASGNGHNGTINNVTPVADMHGKVNAAYHFNGISSYITVPDASALLLANESITLNAWVKLDSYNSSFISAILTKRGPGSGWSLGITGSGSATKGVISYIPDAYSPVTGTRVVDPGQWHMITLVYYEEHQLVVIYIDGVLDNMTQAIPDASSSDGASLYIGRDNPTVPSNGYFFSGDMDEIRIYNRELAPIDIDQLYKIK